MLLLLPPPLWKGNFTSTFSHNILEGGGGEGREGSQQTHFNPFLSSAEAGLA